MHGASRTEADFFWTLCLGSSSEDPLPPLRLLQALLILNLSARGQCMGSSSEDPLPPLRLQVLLMLNLAARGQCMTPIAQRQTSLGPMPGFFFTGSSSPSSSSSGIINTEFVR
jgi:hypothetical protein